MRSSLLADEICSSSIAIPLRCDVILILWVWDSLTVDWSCSSLLAGSWKSLIRMFQQIRCGNIPESLALAWQLWLSNLLMLPLFKSSAHDEEVRVIAYTTILNEKMWHHSICRHLTGRSASIWPVIFQHLTGDISSSRKGSGNSGSCWSAGGSGSLMYLSNIVIPSGLVLDQKKRMERKRRGYVESALSRLYQNISFRDILKIFDEFWVINTVFRGLLRVRNVMFPLSCDFNNIAI